MHQYHYFTHFYEPTYFSRIWLRVLSDDWNKANPAIEATADARVITATKSELLIDALRKLQDSPGFLRIQIDSI